MSELFIDDRCAFYREDFKGLARNDKSSITKYGLTYDVTIFLLTKHTR